ncbi:Spy0128 family protein [Enterococcus villorum]|uniref:Pilin isopeptide linkage domain-containing protein n=3 Tax=Enterococcus villorum TaxID=112904 RepID=A0ABP2UPY3_9ENTE|nr:FctA domain-containing protein [Enterococcus villorum]EOH88876.1 pilin isopeptide linkage domain-containing protein [Enterococcus villorum ATCC 700913]EOW76513.1 hypothetical protein I591_01818 [Enterococcus villorum ATCC 700913]
MKNKFSIYIYIIGLLGAIFCEPAIVLAEALSSSESSPRTAETMPSNQTTADGLAKEPTTDSAGAQTQSSTTQPIENATPETEPSSAQEEQPSDTINQNTIQPRAPDESTVSTREALNANLNERGVQLFQNVRVTDLSDQPFTAENPPMYNGNIKIHFDWALANEEEIQAGDYYTYQLPEYFAIHNEVSGELARAGGQSLGTFTLSNDGVLTVTFNEAAQTLSNRSGSIDLVTELNVSTVTEEVTISTGIYDQDGHEIIITLPIYEIDIMKKGNVTSSGSVVWEIIFNQTKRELHDVVVTDPMPQGLAYSTTSTGYLYDERIDEWVRTDGLYTFNSTNNTFTFNQTVTGPVRIVINSAVTNPSASSFKNTATITSSDFKEKTAEATVTYDQQSEYKRFTGYNQETKRASWELSVTLDKDQAKVLDQTYSGNGPNTATHFFVKESLKITDKDGVTVPAEDWSFDPTYELSKNGEVVRFSLTFAKAGYYKIQYDTQLYESVLSDTRINNYASIRDNQNTSLTGSGTVNPSKTIGVVKTGGTKDYENLTVPWKIETNTNQQEVSNLIIEDRYQLISGANSSALELLADTLVVTASDSTEPLTLNTDYTVSIVRETKTLADGTTSEMETGFRIEMIGAYQTTSATITANFKTRFDVPKQIALGSSSSRFSNSAFAHYTDVAGNQQTEASETNTWLDANWLKNALKYGLFISQGEDVAKAIQAAFGRNLGNIFGETTVSSDQVYWMALFNTYHTKINKDAVIVDQLQEGQTFKDLAVYTASTTGYTTQIRSLKEKLVLGEDYSYTYDPNTKEVRITLLKETTETLAVFLSAEAAEDVFTYKNTITLTDQDTTLKADGQVDKSAKTDWLMKNGSQNAENKRLIDWEVMINADSRKIHNAIVKDTINYNQQTFLLDNNGSPVVEVYEAVLNNGTWEKGSKINFNQVDNPKITTDVAAGTQSLVLAFEETIDKPYFVVYQTQLDPGILNNERVANNVSLTGSEIEIHTVTKEITIKSTDGSRETGIGKEAIFQLSRKNAQNNYEVILSNLIVKNNQIMSDGVALDRIDNLRYGDYMIQEITAPDGYQRDATPYTFTISNEQVNYVFELANQKEIKEIDHVLSAQKILNGRELKDSEFIFELLNDDGSVIQTKKNDATGQVNFDPITYNDVGEYHYTIREKAGNDQTITYDTKELKVTVNVAEKDNQLVATATYEGNPVFENNYQPKAGNVVLNAEKVLTGRDLKANEFEFELVDEEGKVLQTKTNDSTGQIYFDELAYKEAGEHHYTIREKVGADSTITYDTKELGVNVKVTDEDGQLVATATYEGNTVFENNYQPKAGNVVLNAEKVLTGRDLKANEFEFELVDEEGKVLQTKTNDNTGQIYFDELAYKEAGEHHYAIREKVGADSTITYDTKELGVNVKVTDEDGQLVATATYEGNTVFENNYQPKAGNVVLNAEKVLTGRDLKANEFEFELVDEEGKVLQTKTNDSTGQIYFDELVYKEAGEHHYTIREKAGADSTITYDTKEYQVTVNVKDQAGKLIAEVVQKEPAVFNNQVKTTKQDDANVPNTPNRNTPVLPNLPNRNTPVLPSMPSRDTKSLPNTINRNTPNLPKTNETTKIGWIVLGIILLVVTVVVIYFTRKQRKLF